MISIFFLDHQKTLVLQFATEKTVSFCFTADVQVLVSAARKPKQAWPAESFC